MLEGDMAFPVPITGKHHYVVGYALVSEIDWKWALGFAWNSNRDSYYAIRRAPEYPSGAISMHREILLRAGFDLTGLEVDHINGQRLDNRRSNLRPATKAQNMRNLFRVRTNSGYRGVQYRCGKTPRWCARIRPPGQKHKQIGSFRSAEEAARAYDREAVALFGEFAALNFPDEHRKAQPAP